MPDLSPLLQLPAIVKIAVVFAALLAALRLRVTLELALLSGGFLLDLWAGRGGVSRKPGNWSKPAMAPRVPAPRPTPSMPCSAANGLPRCARR